MPTKARVSVLYSRTAFAPGSLTRSSRARAERGVGPATAASRASIEMIVRCCVMPPPRFDQCFGVGADRTCSGVAAHVASSSGGLAVLYFEYLLVAGRI